MSSSTWSAAIISTAITTPPPIEGRIVQIAFAGKPEGDREFRRIMLKRLRP